MTIGGLHLEIQRYLGSYLDLQDILFDFDEWNSPKVDNAKIFGTLSNQS